MVQCCVARWECAGVRSNAKVRGGPRNLYDEVEGEQAGIGVNPPRGFTANARAAWREPRLANAFESPERADFNLQRRQPSTSVPTLAWSKSRPPWPCMESGSLTSPYPDPMFRIGHESHRSVASRVIVRNRVSASGCNRGAARTGAIIVCFPRPPRPCCRHTRGRLRTGSLDALSATATKSDRDSSGRPFSSPTQNIDSELRDRLRITEIHAKAQERMVRYTPHFVSFDWSVRRRGS